MKYNFYERKDELVTKEQSEWIEANIELISKNEDILFVFQAEHEALVFTTGSIFFPNRKLRRKIGFDEIIAIKIAGDFYIELKITNKEVYTMIFVTPIDKVKIFKVLNHLFDNFKKGKNSSFEDTHKILRDFTVLKYPLKQLQHKLPRVYLKHFGYLENKQWKVSIMQKGEKFSRKKSIGSFTAETNIFDIESDDDRFPRMFEELNSDLENLYHEMIDDIANNSPIPDKCWEIIVQLTPNLMVRSDYWRSFVSEILNGPRKGAFLEITLSIYAKSIEDLNKIKKKPFYQSLQAKELTPSILNKTLLHLLNYIFYHLKSLDLVIIKAPKGNEFFTSDNPVNFKPNQEDGKLGLFSKDTEVYLPLSTEYLAYFHYRNSTRKSKLRALENRRVYNADEIFTEEEFSNLVREEIINNSHNLIIIPGKFDYKIEH